MICHRVLNVKVPTYLMLMINNVIHVEGFVLKTKGAFNKPCIISQKPSNER